MQNPAADHGAAGQWGRDQPRRACTPEMGEHELLPFLLGSTGSALARARQKVIARITMMMSGRRRLCLLARWVGWLSALCGFRRVFEIGGGERGRAIGTIGRLLPEKLCRGKLSSSFHIMLGVLCFCPPHACMQENAETGAGDRLRRQCHMLTNARRDPLLSVPRSLPG